MKLNWNFLGGQGVQNKKPSVGGVWIFSGTAQCSEPFNTYFYLLVSLFVFLGRETVTLVLIDILKL